METINERDKPLAQKIDDEFKRKLIEPLGKYSSAPIIAVVGCKFCGVLFCESQLINGTCFWCEPVKASVQ